MIDDDVHLDGGQVWASGSGLEAFAWRLGAGCIKMADMSMSGIQAGVKQRRKSLALLYNVAAACRVGCSKPASPLTNLPKIESPL